MKRKLLSLLVLLLMAATGAWAQSTYNVTVKDAELAYWTVSVDGGNSYVSLPQEVAEGTTVTAAYAGDLKVKSVKAANTAGDITVYFTDAQGFGNVYVYYWDKDGYDNDWPGKAMTLVGYNDFGENIYKAEIPAEVKGIIFNGNGRQTVDITEGIVDGALWYTNGVQTNGRYNVGYVGDYYKIKATSTDGIYWSFKMPGYDVELEMEYYPGATVTTAPTAAEGVIAGTDAALVTGGVATGGTLNYAIGESNTQAPAFGWSEDIPTAENLTAGTCYVWYKVVGDAEHSDTQPQCIEVTIAALPTYAVTIDDGNVDATNWVATPAEQKAGQKVTLTYSGKKKIRSITIEKAPDTTPATATLADAFVDGNETVIEFTGAGGLGDLSLTATYNSGSFGTVTKGGAMASMVTSASMEKNGNNLIITVTVMTDFGDMTGYMTIDTVNNTYSWNNEGVGDTITLTAITIGGKSVNPLPTAAQQ